MILALVALALIFMAALFSGLNLGLMSLDTFELKRKAELGDHNAMKVYRIRAKGNLLLVTLLTGNVAVISAFSIVLNSLYDGVVAGVLTTILVTIFGEIVPQAILARYALRIGAQLADIVRVIIFIGYPVCAPIAYVLDKILGDELPTVYTKSELSRIIDEHGSHDGSGIDGDEARIARGALSFGDRTIQQIMTPHREVVMIAEDLPIDNKAITHLKATGFSRIPVYRTEEPNTFVGVLLIKDLLGLAGHKTAGELARAKVFFARMDDTLDDALNAFLRTRNHLFIVIDEQAEVRGIVTIEDILEEIIDSEIDDEFDVAHRIKRVGSLGSGKS